MVAKISKGRDFGGLVRYVLQEGKDARVLDSRDVLLADRKSIADSFRLQCQLRPGVKIAVGHVSLNFPVEDADKVDDNLMRLVAGDYMHRMSIQDTQYIIVRHYDRSHPHCHVVFNRIDNNGNVISDKNDRKRSAKACKELTREYHLHIAKGKDHVHRERLRGADAVRYQIYDALVATVPRCKNWKELETALERQGIGVDFTLRGNTTQVQGVVFTKDGFRFNGSKVDRRFSFSKISRSFAGKTRVEHRGMGQKALNESGSLGDVGLDVVSSVADVSLSIADAFVLGIVHSLAIPNAPSASGGVSPDAGSSCTDLAADEYIDGYGIRRKKRRGRRR